MRRRIAIGPSRLAPSDLVSHSPRQRRTAPKDLYMPSPPGRWPPRPRPCRTLRRVPTFPNKRRGSRRAFLCPPLAAAANGANAAMNTRRTAVRMVLHPRNASVCAPDRLLSLGAAIFDLAQCQDVTKWIATLDAMGSTTSWYQSRRLPRRMRRRMEQRHAEAKPRRGEPTPTSADLASGARARSAAQRPRGRFVTSGVSRSLARPPRSGRFAVGRGDTCSGKAFVSQPPPPLSPRGETVRLKPL